MEKRALWRTLSSMERGYKQPDPAASVRLSMQSTPQEFADQTARAFFPKYDSTYSITCPEIYELEPSAKSDISSHFGMAEIIAAIDTSHRGTTPGPDGISYEVFKNMEGEALDALLQAINKV